MIRDHMYVLAVHDLDRSAAFYMREFGLRTVDGHRLMLGHELPAA